MVSKQKAIWTWVVWFMLSVPAITFLVDRYLQNPSFQFYEIIVILILAIISAYFSATIHNKPFFFLRTISITTFILYGLFAEIIITQVAVLVAIRRLNVTKREHYRIPLNLLLFFIGSILSALAYYGVGYYFSSELIFINQNIYQLVAFTLTSIIVNKVMVYLLQRFYFKARPIFINKRFFVSFLSAIYSMASALLMVYLFEFFGTIGILIVGVHVLFTLIIINLYVEIRKSNEYLEMIYQITFKLSEHHSREKGIATYFSMLYEHFSVSTIGLYTITDQQDYELFYLQKNGEAIHLPPERVTINDQSSFKELFRSNSIISYQKRKDWKHEFSPYFLERAESLVALPINDTNKMQAILIMVDKKQHAFKKKKIKQLMNLTHSFSSLLGRAGHYQELRSESETDYLTGLPNMRRFEKYLNNYKENLKTSNTSTINCSLIMMDLDHFKKVNDTYGHECGNELLIEIAQLLNRFFDDKGVVFRYGGEEFLIFLPNYSQESSVRLAESFRRVLEETEFICHNYIDQDHSKVKVKVTGSLGVASYPEKTDDVDRLVKLADRAMYLGAKRAGRNKVSVYEV